MPTAVAFRELLTGKNPGYDSVVKANSLWLLICVFLANCVRASGTDELNTKTVDVDSNKDGRPDLRMEVISRDSERQMMVMSRADKSGEWKVTARSFYVGPHVGVTETDEDRDGFFEMFAVYRENPEDVNAFVRERDGSVHPADPTTVDALRKQTALLTEFWSNPVKDPENADEAIEEIRDKIKKAWEGVEKAE